jgi:phage tail sheath protein FI
MVIVDPPVGGGAGWTDLDKAVAGAATLTSSKNAAVYFPRIREADPLRDLQIGTFAPSGAIAGVIARTDATRGVWKAPAGLDATLAGVVELAIPLTDLEIGRLNPLGVNCLRNSPGAGNTVWGARTRAGSDRLASEWKYLPVRRTALFLEESLYRGTQWVVFEPNDAPLWAQIRLNVGAFMNNLFRQGAFAGTTPREAFFVKCDAETTTQDDVNLGIVNIVVGFAPLKPAEFVVIRLQQMAGQTGSA